MSDNQKTALTDNQRALIEELLLWVPAVTWACTDGYSTTICGMSKFRSYKAIEGRPRGEETPNEP